MEYRQRQTQARRSGVPERTSRANRNPPPKPDHNELRRKQYANDEGYAERQRELSRNTYRKDNPLAASKLRDGLLAQGTPREVQTDDMEYPTTVEAFTIPEAARALGRTELTLRRWIADDLVPEPILIDTTYHYRQYSAWVCAKKLAMSLTWWSPSGLCDLQNPIKSHGISLVP